MADTISSESIDRTNFPTSNGDRCPGVAQDSNLDFWHNMNMHADPSSLDHEWGHVLKKSHKMKINYKMNDVGSVAGSAAYSASDLSEALSAVSAALSLSSSSHSSEKDQGLDKDFYFYEGPTHLERNLDDENTDKSTKDHSSLDIQPLSSESDEDDFVSPDSNGDVQAQSDFDVNAEIGEDRFQVPELGMIFSSEEEAYFSYKNYANKTGFKVRKGKVQRLSNGTIRKRYFFCSRQGFRSEKQSSKITKYRRKETRTGCDARIELTFENGKWIISQTSQVHNHFLEGVTGTENTGQLEKKNNQFEYSTYGVCNRPAKKMRTDQSSSKGCVNKKQLGVESGKASSSTIQGPSICKTFNFSVQELTVLDQASKKYDYGMPPLHAKVNLSKLLKIDYEQVEAWFQTREEQTKSMRSDLRNLEKENDQLRRVIEFWVSEHGKFVAAMKSLLGVE